MADAPTVLVVEDEENFIEALTIGLKKEGFRVQVARDGAEALLVFDAVRPDIVLLDLMLPKVSGVDVCREMRSRSKVPIIMVTAKGSEVDTVVGLEVGADDYVTKPYRLRELVARMRAVLRRAAERAPDRSPGTGDEVLASGDLFLDPERHEVVAPRRDLGPAPQGVRGPAAPARAGGPGGHPRRSSSTRSGAMTTWATPRPSTSTSSGSAAGSRPTRRCPNASSPCGAWGTRSWSRTEPIPE